MQEFTLDGKGACTLDSLHLADTCMAPQMNVQPNVPSLNIYMQPILSVHMRDYSADDVHTHLTLQNRFFTLVWLFKTLFNAPNFSANKCQFKESFKDLVEPRHGHLTTGAFISTRFICLILKLPIGAPIQPNLFRELILECS